MRVTVKEPATLIAFLQGKMPEASKTKLRSLLKHHAVLVDGVAQSIPSTPIARGQVIEILSVEARTVENARRKAPFDILYEDDFVIAVNKPKGWLSIAREDETRETLYQAVFDYVRAATNEKQRCFIVHRLDREVSGVMILAKTEEAKRRLMNSWDHNEKVYTAVVEGIPHPAEGTITSYLDETSPARVRVVHKMPGAREAITHYKVLKQTETHALVEIRIETGRRHQIRAHLASIGCPIAGDKRYGARTNPLQRVALHSTRLTFDHPVSKQRVRIEANVPMNFRKFDNLNPYLLKHKAAVKAKAAAKPRAPRKPKA